MARRVRDFIAICADDFSSEHLSDPHYKEHADAEFNGIALMLFILQFQHNTAYRKICEARKLAPPCVTHWKEIPAVPTSAFKELELTSLPPKERTHVFHSSGTTGQIPSRHFHNAESLGVYEVSALTWLGFHIPRETRLAILTPPPADAPHSSLVHMLELARKEFHASENSFFGRLAADHFWTLDFEATVHLLADACRRNESVVLLGTAFSFVHLLDYLAENTLRFNLPGESRVMETGGYKNRSRVLPKEELHRLVGERLGVPRSHIVCEYGMSELSSQAYSTPWERRPPARHATDTNSQPAGSETGAPPHAQHFHFPPWARARVISPETGREVVEGETGLLRVYDLANVFSVMAIQTEDLAIRRGDGFELIGRAEPAEPRGCSLMSHDP